MAKKLTERWAQDENPVGFDEKYEYDKSKFKPVEINHIEDKNVEEYLEEQECRRNEDTIEEL